MRSGGSTGSTRRLRPRRRPRSVLVLARQRFLPLALMLVLMLLIGVACSRDAPEATDDAAAAASAASAATQTERNRDAGTGVKWPIPGLEHYVPAPGSGPAPAADSATAAELAPPRSGASGEGPSATRELSTHDLRAQQRREREYRAPKAHPVVRLPDLPGPTMGAPPPAPFRARAPRAPRATDTPNATHSTERALTTETEARAPPSATVPDAEQAAAAAARGKQGLFWGVRSGNATVFLLGSIHLTRGDIYLLEFPPAP